MSPSALPPPERARAPLWPPLQRLVAWSLQFPIRAGVLFATLACAPALFSGWLLDDWIHRGAILHKLPLHDADLLKLFTFANGDRADAMLHTRFGYGWWTLPDLRLAFFRPLSALTHHFDERVLGPHAFLHHAHSLLWQALGIVAAGLVFRRLLAARTAMTATLLYAIDEAHWAASNWLSNRNAWVSMVPALFGFWLWLRAEDEAWTPGFLLAPLLFGVGLCGGETALGLSAVWLAVALLRRRAPLARTLGRLAPLIVVLAAWMAFYKMGHFGAAASGAYVDPATDPLRYLGLAAHRIPTLAGGLIASLPVELGPLSEVGSWLLAAGGLAAVVLLGRGLRRAALPVEDRRSLVPLAVGGLLALVPPAATWPSLRTLLAPSLVSAALVAMMLMALGESLAAGPLAALRVRLARRYLVLVHVIWPPLISLAVSCLLLLAGPQLTGLLQTPTLTGIRDKHVVVVAAPDPVIGFYLVAFLGSYDHEMPKQFNVLAMTYGDVTVERTGVNRLRVRTLGDPLLSTAPEQLIMDPRRMPKAGDTLEIPNMTVHVEAASPAGVEVAEFVFAVPLEELALLQWHEHDLQPLALTLGEVTTIRHERGVIGI